MPTVVTRNDDDVDDDDNNDGNGSSSECDYENIGHLFRQFGYSQAHKETTLTTYRFDTPIFISKKYETQIDALPNPLLLSHVSVHRRTSSF